MHLLPLLLRAFFCPLFCSSTSPLTPVHGHAVDVSSRLRLAPWPWRTRADSSASKAVARSTPTAGTLSKGGLLFQTVAVKKTAASCRCAFAVGSLGWRWCPPGDGGQRREFAVPVRVHHLCSPQPTSIATPSPSPGPPHPTPFPHTPPSSSPASPTPTSLTWGAVSPGTLASSCSCPPGPYRKTVRPPLCGSRCPHRCDPPPPPLRSPPRCSTICNSSRTVHQTPRCSRRCTSGTHKHPTRWRGDRCHALGGAHKGCGSSPPVGHTCTWNRGSGVGGAHKEESSRRRQHNHSVR